MDKKRPGRGLGLGLAGRGPLSEDVPSGAPSVQEIHVPSFVAMSALAPVELGALAYEALRLAFIPWQRERRINLEMQRARTARRNAMLGGGVQFSLALRRDGRVACWGDNDFGQAPPDGVDGDFIAIDAGDFHSLALQRDGSIACWGWNNNDQAPPAGVDGNFVAIAAGWRHSIALRRDGGIACWGSNHHGEAPPDGVDGDFVAIAAGWRHSLALRRDGGITCWGGNADGQAPPGGVLGPFAAQVEL